ncbi:MAG: nucleotide exchange factor GrpE [Hyphomicrobiaceae bacterium]
MSNDPKQPGQAPAGDEPANNNEPLDQTSNDPEESGDPATEAADDGNLSPETLEAAFQALADERDSYKDRYMRTFAEMENIRKRAEREKADLRKYAITDFARDVLGLGDNIQRAIAAVPAEAAEQDSHLKSFREGIELLERELLQMLERHGVQRLDPQGHRFDPNQHQAVMEMERPDLPAGSVAEVFQAGYTIGDRVLRPAMVAVAKGGAKMAKETEAAAEEAVPAGVTAETGPPDGEDSSNN